MTWLYLYGILTGSAITSLSFVIYKVFSCKKDREMKYQASIKVGQNYHSGIVTFREIK